MTVTFVVLAVAVGFGLLFFVLSAVRALPEPVDPVDRERAFIRRLARHPRLRRFLRRRLDPAAAGGLVLTVALLAAFAVAVVVGAVLDMVSGSFGLATLDDGVAQWGLTHADSASVDILRAITYLGDTVVVLAAMLAAGLIDVIRHRRPQVFAFLAVVIVGEKLIVNGLKEVVGRDRPNVAQLVGWEGPSFPSGHAAAAAAAWPAIALVLGRGYPRLIRALLAAGAGLIAAGVAASRALLGVHWLTDIVAGVVIGYGWFLICAMMFGGRAQRLGDPLTAQPQGTSSHPE
jgi:membrane-associated phospholipid phosphatase